MLPLMKDGEWAVCQQRSTGNEGCWCKHSAACLKKWGKRATRALWYCWPWADYDLDTWAGKSSWRTRFTVEGRKGRTSRAEFNPSISATLQTWWLLRKVTGAAQTYGCCLNYSPISLNSHCPEQDHDEKVSSPSCFCRLEGHEMETTCVKEHPKSKPQKLLQAEAENPLHVHLNLASSFRLW